MNVRCMRVKNALVRECMAEFLGTFILLVSDPPAFDPTTDLEGAFGSTLLPVKKLNAKKELIAFIHIQIHLNNS